ncbi:thioesterase domain-containing protein [Methylorubrum sp. SB2]|uniref:thioesterase domain-containing protein n=1 Tax=Methylorubrum subtropicum TaxID=3138812 RepID=UPI00313F17C9
MEPESLESERERERTRARRLEKLRFWRTACADGMPVATRHNDESEAPPLFFFHGDWDNGGLYMARLAAELPCPVIGLAPHLDPVPPTVCAMAQDRLPAILAAQPEGPYRIGGFCNGALVAYEAARLLLAQGRAVEVVLLVAPPSLNALRRYRGLLAWAERWLGAGPEAPPARRHRLVVLMGQLIKLWRLSGYALTDIETVMARKRRLRASARARLDPRQVGKQNEIAAEAAILHRRRALLAAYEAAVYPYAPAPIPARLVVFGTGLNAAGRPAPGYDAAYDGRAWAELCPQAVCVPVAGDHYTCIADHVSDLTRAMSLALCAGPDPARRGAWHGPVLAPVPERARFSG